MIGKLAVLLLPALLCSATLVDDASSDACFQTYTASCCALGDGTANSGFTPGEKTRCVNEDLGSPWFCPHPNPPLSPGHPLFEVDGDTSRHTSCETGEKGCRKEWQAADTTSDCKARRYTCSTVMHGVCSARPENVQWTCQNEVLLGDTCRVYADATSTGFGDAGSGGGGN